MKDDVTNEQFLTMDFKSFTCALLRGKYYIKMGGIQILNPMYKSQVESYLKNFTHDFDVTPATHVLKWLNDLEFLNEVTAECFENTHLDIGLLEYAKSICKTNDSSRIAEKKPFCFMDIEIPRTWKNGQYGYMVADSNRYVFMEYRMNDVIHDERPTLVFNTVADKFVGYWLQHRIGDTKETFENYFQVALKHYVDTHQSESDAWCRDLEAEFLRLHAEMEEQAFVKCALMNILTEPERKIIQEYYDSYQEWFNSSRNGIKKRRKSRSGINTPTRCDLTKYKDYIALVFEWFKNNGGVIPQDFTFDDFMNCCNKADFGRIWSEPNQLKGLTRYLVYFTFYNMNLNKQWLEQSADSIETDKYKLNKNRPGKSWTEFPRFDEK